MDVKTVGLTDRLHSKLFFLSEVEASGIPSVAVKCVDIRRNTSGEGGLLGFYCGPYLGAKGRRAGNCTFKRR